MCRSEMCQSERRSRRRPNLLVVVNELTLFLSSLGISPAPTEEAPTSVAMWTKMLSSEFAAPPSDPRPSSMGSRAGSRSSILVSGSSYASPDMYPVDRVSYCWNEWLSSIDKMRVRLVELKLRFIPSILSSCEFALCTVLAWGPVHTWSCDFLRSLHFPYVRP